MTPFSLSKRARGQKTPLLAPTVSEEQPTPERLTLDNETWGHRDLAEVISSRYFELGEDEIGIASWRVTGIGGKTEGSCLVDLNEHLGPLGLIGVLDIGNPPILSISEIPDRSPALPRWQQFAVWLSMFSFMTIAGVGLITRNSPETQFGIDVLSQSILTFSLPIILVAVLSSEARRLVAKRHGVRLESMVPLGFPLADAVWPFGIAGLLPQNRPDRIPYPNRRALAHIEISAPFVTFFCGLVLSIIGLNLTLSTPPGLESSPLVITANPLLDLISNPWLGDEFLLRLQWLHPTGVAGLGLCIVSWIMLMPIPGFPGDHLLHSIFGPDKILAEDKQTYIFGFTLVLLVMAFSSNTWVPWLFLTALATWRRFSPNSMLDPFVVDENTGFDDLSRNRTIVAVALLLVAGFPGINGAYHMPEWDSGLSTEDWPSQIEFADGQANFELVLEPAGIVPVSGWLQMRVEGDPVGEWRINSECLDEREVCRFDEITQASPGGISVNLSREVDATPHPFRLVILIDVHGHVDEHSIVFQPYGASTSIDPLWILVEDTETPRICVEIIVVEGDYINLTNGNQFWYFENETSLAPGTHDLCMRGHEGALFSQERSPDHFFSMGPTITILRNNQTPQHLVMPIDNSQLKLQFSDGDWRLPLSNLPYEFSITRGESGSAFCPSTDVIVEVNSTGDWERELSDRSSIFIPAGHSGNGTIRMGGPGWLAICSGTNMLSWFSMVEGPDVFTYSGEELTIFNRENYSMPISIDWKGDADEFDKWDISVPSGIDAMSSVFVNMTSNDDSHAPLVYWVTTDENGINLNLAARSNLGD